MCMGARTGLVQRPSDHSTLITEVLSEIGFEGTEARPSPIEGRRGCNIDAAGRHHAHSGNDAEWRDPANS